MSARYHYPEEFQRARMSGAFVFLLGVGIVCVAAATGFICGMEWQSALYKEAQRIERERGKRTAIPPATAATILNCPVSKHGVEEWHRVCRARERTAKVGQ